MSGRSSRLQRKATRVVRDERETEYDAALGQLRARRDEALHKIGEQYRSALEELNTTRYKARAAVHSDYDEQRDAIIKEAAAAIGETA